MIQFQVKSLNLLLYTVQHTGLYVKICTNSLFYQELSNLLPHTVVEFKILILPNLQSWHVGTTAFLERNGYPDRVKTKVVLYVWRPLCWAQLTKIQYPLGMVSVTLEPMAKILYPLRMVSVKLDTVCQNSKPTTHCFHHIGRSWPSCYTPYTWFLLYWTKWIPFSPRNLTCVFICGISNNPKSAQILNLVKQ